MDGNIKPFWIYCIIFAILIIGIIFSLVKKLHQKEIEYNQLRENETNIRNQQRELDKQRKEINKEINTKISTIQNKYNEGNYENLKLQYELDIQRSINTNLQNELNVQRSENINLQYELDMQRNKNTNLQKKLDTQHNELENLLTQKTAYYPHLAGVIADYLTYDFEILAKSLDWGRDVKRLKKVASIREIRKDAKERIAEAKIATYELAYLKSLYPVLDDVLDNYYEDLNFKPSLSTEHDPIRDFLSKEEWRNLPESEKNQLALERYINSHRKSKWQIGRDYELYCGYKYSLKGYDVTYFGEEKRLEDLGRDLILKNKDNDYVIIVQCKYWSTEKQIHEKHIFQLYGTTISYAIENNLNPENVKGVFITSTTLSATAKKAAEFLNISIREKYPMGNYPRIKCNINYSDGMETRIYHLPMDLQYDNVKIDKPGEFYAFSVKEAEEKGFRRAYKWHGISN